MKKITYALPAFNEAENLPALLKSLETAGAQVRHLGYAVSYVIVDDGSTDATPAILAAWAKDRDATIITHSPNQGLGKTISDALECAARHASPEDIIVTLDADNTQPPGLLTAMVLKVIEGNDLVIASRYRYGARVLGLAWHRHLMSWGAALLFRCTFPISGVRDYTCGYRAYSAAYLRRGFEKYQGQLVTERGFQCMAEILLRLSKVDPYPSFVEVPMVLRYYQKQGGSKMKVMKTVISTLRMLACHRLGLQK